MICAHTASEMDVACIADGYCPLCLAEGNGRLREALKAVLADLADYERVNHLYPSPGREYCWDSVARAHAVLGPGHSNSGNEQLSGEKK